MNDKITKDHHVFRKETEDYYRNIACIYSPALKSYVQFTSDGFHHLRYDGSRKERKKSIQISKFRSLKYVPNIIEKSTTVQEYRREFIPHGEKDKNRFKKSKCVEWFAFFAITSFSKKYRIKVIVRRIGGDSGKIHFWSVIPFWTLRNGDRYIGSRSIQDN